MIRFGDATVGIARGAKLMFSAFEDGGDMWTGQGAREARTRVVFLEPFLSPPVVQVGIGMWDMGGDTNQRADIQADRITAEGFDLVFSTWGDTRVARIRAEWLAIGPARHLDDFDDI